MPDDHVVAALRRGVPAPHGDDAWPAIRTRASRRRRWHRGLAIVGMASLVGLGFLALPEESTPSHRITVTDTRPEVPPWPGLRVADGEAHLSFTLLDGTTGTLIYPEGILDDARISLGDSAFCDDRCARAYGFSDVSAVRDTELFSGSPRLATLAGVDGSEVELVDLAVDRLVYRFGPWSVVLHTGAMGPGDPAVWARSLDGEVTDDGWLLVRGIEPITVGGEPELEPGLDLEVDGVHVAVRAGDCREDGENEQVEPMQTQDPTQHRTQQASFSQCLDGEVFVTVSGDIGLVEQLAGAISVDDVVLPPT